MNFPEGVSPLEQQVLEQTCHNLILGSHILHHHGILDAYGHLSVRHPFKPDIFIMPRNMAPANISSMRDLVEYRISDASAVDSTAPRGYIERYIHSETFKRYPEIKSVAHSHAPAVIPYTVTAVPLKPCFHMAGFLGTATPVFDIAKHYIVGERQDLLVCNAAFGESLASCFGKKSESNEPKHSVVLMRGHGFTAVARSVQECVFRAIYTNENAAIQTMAVGLISAHNRPAETVPSVQYLDEGEAEGTTAMTEEAWSRAWSLWIREASASSLYVHHR